MVIGAFGVTVLSKMLVCQKFHPLGSLATDRMVANQYQWSNHWINSTNVGWWNTPVTGVFLMKVNGASG